MYFVEKELESEDGKIYLQIRIHTACCKRSYIVEALPNEQFYDLEMLSTVPAGAREGIIDAWKLFKEKGPPTKW